jgi:hypothetical protein
MVTHFFRHKMKKMIHIYGLMLLGCCLAGCASTHQINVNGYTDPSGAPAAIIPGRAFAVVENKDAQNPLLEKEIREKIDKLLISHGYQIAPLDRADYYLFFGYGIGQDRNVSVALPDFYPGGGFGFGIGSGGYRSSYIFAAPFMGFYPFPETVYDRWLLLNVVDARYYRENGEFRTVWVGEARSSGTSSDLRVLINYLLLADFKEFGLNTGKAVTVDIKDYDAQVYGLTK